MKQTSLLKRLRVILAILFFVPIILYFVDFANLLPDSLHGLLHLQIVPAILAGILWIIIAQLLLVLVFGRLYCSVICPAGVLQDIINRIYCIGKKKKNGKRRFRYKKPMNWFRYGLLALTTLLALVGSIELLLLLDPYSNFGRVAANLFRPLVIWGNNLIADVLMKFDNYTLYHVTIETITIPSLIAGAVVLLLFIGLVAWRGRLFCNTLCPVGSLLGLISRYSLLNINFDKNACIQCGKCEKSCKAEAIDMASMHVDNSRCVDCFNCISSCSKDALHYSVNPLFKNKEINKDTAKTANVSSSRRSFLSTGITVASTVPLAAALAEQVNGQKRHRERAHGEENEANWSPVTPPGSISLERFKDTCTGCHLCVVQCPTHILKPAGLEYGFDYLLKPHLSYNSSYCNYECTVCSDVCPNHAIKPLTVEQKITTQVGIAHFIKHRCIVEIDGTDCGACSEHCPTQAVKMVPYKGDLRIPQVEPEICIGCGGCESICPARPARAIIIKANEVHLLAEKPKEEEIKEVVVDEFGF